MMDIKQYKAAVFDFDGTLIDSMNMWTDIDIEYLARFGHEFSRDLQTDIEGMSTDEMAVYFRNRYGIPRTNEEMKRDWTELCRYKYLYETDLKPYAETFLKKLRKEGIMTAIATSTELDIAVPFLEKRGLSKYFDCIATTTESGKGKPDPGVFLLAAKRLGVKPGRCIAFEDLPAGIIAAKNAGMYTVAVHDSFSEDRNDIKRELADIFINDFSELM